MGDVIEPAASGRAKCRACGRAIAKGELRFGERLPNPFGEGEASYWFHLECAACKRPDKAVAAIEELAEPPADAARLLALGRRGVAHPRLSRVARAERSPSNRARCRHCRERIDKDLWRIALDWWEDGRFGPAGFLHVACAPAYFGDVDDLVARLRRFSPELGEADLAAIEAELAAAPPPEPADPEPTDPAPAEPVAAGADDDER